MADTIKAHFGMSLWQRIKAASILWWDIVVTKELACIDDEKDNIAGTKLNENDDRL